jgi:hypothetical protein
MRFTFGEFAIDPALRELRRGDTAVEIRRCSTFSCS